MKKVFIFGIGGFAGSYLAQEFIDNGYVVAGSDKVKSESLNKLVDFVEADLLNAENIEKIVSENNDIITHNDTPSTAVRRSHNHNMIV